MAPPLLVFDLDGTLVDTAPDLLATLDAVLPRHGFRAPADPGLRNAIGHGARRLIEEALSRQKVTLAEPALDALFRDFLVHYEANICAGSRLYPGADALLERFAAAGWTFAVCTNKKERLSRLLLQALGVAEKFAAVCGGDTFGACKPDPAHLFGTIAAAGGTPNRTVMAGDSRTDFDTAERAGVAFVGVTFGYTTVPMADLRPDLLIEDFDALSPEAAARLFAQRARAAPDARTAPAPPTAP
ncbi:MAG: HAD hydrolase-like protein [Propylenella sp.]